MSGQTRSASSQFSSWFFAPSPPMNVLTSGTSIFSAAAMTCLRWPMTCAAMRRVGMERVRVVAEAGDRRGPSPRSRRRSRSPALGGQVRDVDVAACRRSGGSARSSAASRRSRGPRSRSPAVQSATSVERRLGERRGQEAEPHRAATSCAAGGRAGGDRRPRSTSTQRPRRALSAIASLTSISSWPSAKVGVGGSRGRAARRRRRRRSPGRGRANVSPKPSTWPPGSAAAARPAGAHQAPGSG